MSRPTTFRPLAGLTLALGLVLASPGCKPKAPPADKGDKKDKKDAQTPTPGTGPGTTPGGGPVVQAPKKVELESGVGKEAVEFLKSLREGEAKADRVSAAFIKQIGLPAELPSDKAKGYSADAAASWLKRVGSGLSFFPPSGFAAADAAVLGGTFMSPERSGHYSLRMVNEGGTWKVDYLAMSSVNVTTVQDVGGGPESEYQRFAARAVAGLLCDNTGMPKDDRAAALAAGLTPALRAQWAEPFGSDKDQGYDYNRGKLLLEAAKVGAGCESYGVAQQGADPVFRLEVTKAGGAKAAYTLKLTKGTTPGQWLVESVTPQ